MDRKKNPDENVDTFWDIDDLVPVPRKKTPSQKTASYFDTEATEIDLDTAAEKQIPIPKKTAVTEEKKKQPIREYSPKNGFIEKVIITPWPTDFSFYMKFRRDAVRLFPLSHAPCDYVYFFSYMPQYDQMTGEQLSYYLYWRSEARKGNYLKININYLFLYTYEIINLPDKVPPEEGAILLSRLWKAYREDFQYLDKYLGEWLCDYCLLYGVEPEWELLDTFAGEIAAKVSLPEFYLRDGKLTWPLIKNIAAYDYKKSKYYEKNAALFDKHIPQAAEYVCTLVTMNPKKYGVEPIRMMRDSFAGAVVCRDVKCKITVLCAPLKRSLELKQILTGVIKLCENQIRAVCAVKSRFVPHGVNEELKEAVSEYFDKFYPNRNVKRRKEKENPENAPYMALYEPQNDGPADIERALAIEEEAWETAELLETEEDTDVLAAEKIPGKAEPVPDLFALPQETDDDEFAFLATLDRFTKQAIASAAGGKFDDFCRENGKISETVKGEINDIAMENLGDIIVDDDFTLIPDYEEDILRVLGP